MRVKDLLTIECNTRKRVEYLEYLNGTYACFILKMIYNPGIIMVIATDATDEDNDSICLIDDLEYKYERGAPFGCNDCEYNWGDM